MLGASILTWGYFNWDYGEKSAHTQSEGWFGHETAHGGADKLGHMYTGYVLTHGAASIYREWGFARHEASLYGAGTSLLITGLRCLVSVSPEPTEAIVIPPVN